MSHFIHLSVIGESSSLFFSSRLFIFDKSFSGLFVNCYDVDRSHGKLNILFFNDNEEETTGWKANVINDVLSSPLAVAFTEATLYKRFEGI